ncbi:hypothetical protein D3C73_1446010 [compost metagenome]
MWSNTIANWYYQQQVIKTSDLASIIDKTNSLVLQSANIGKSVQAQASLLAIRDSYNGLFIVGLILVFLILVFPYHSSPTRRIFNWKRKNATKEALQIPVA